MKRESNDKRRKITKQDIKDALLSICKEKVSQEDSDNIQIIKSAEIQAWLYMERDISVTSQTLRNNGFCKRGYFDKKYTEAKYNEKGPSHMMGLVVNLNDFIEVLE